MHQGHWITGSSLDDGPTHASIYNQLLIHGSVVDHTAPSRVRSRNVSSHSRSLLNCRLHFQTSSFRIFIARCYYAYRGLCCRKMSVRPSVCMSHASIMSKPLNISSKHFYRRVATSHTILVFPYQTLRQYSDGVPYNGGTNNRDFRPISRFISEMIQDKAMVTMECE